MNQVGNLHRWKRQAHAAFDPLWLSTTHMKHNRIAAYNWLAKRLGISRDQCQIAEFDADTCKQVVSMSREALRPWTEQ